MFLQVTHVFNEVAFFANKGGELPRKFSCGQEDILARTLLEPRRSAIIHQVQRVIMTHARVHRVVRSLQAMSTRENARGHHSCALSRVSCRTVL